jgi:hypothetical protein
VVSSTGAIVVLASGFEQLDAGTIIDVVPAHGQYKTQVTITGTLLRGGADSIIGVALGGVDVEEIVSESDTSVTVIVSRADASGSGSGSSSGSGLDISFTTDSGAILVVPNAWTYNEEGQVLSATPTQGQKDTNVVLVGTNLLGGGESFSSIMIGVNAPAEVLEATNTRIELIADNGAAASAQDIVLVANTGAVVTGAGLWTYIARGDIQSVFPAVGQEGTLVTIRGERLRGDGSEIVEVSLAALRVKELISESDTEVVVMASLAPDSTCNVCEYTCSECESAGASMCSSCPALLTFVPDGEYGSCESPCAAGTYRDGAGSPVVSAVVSL